MVNTDSRGPWGMYIPSIHTANRPALVMDFATRLEPCGKESGSAADFIVTFPVRASMHSTFPAHASMRFTVYFPRACLYAFDPALVQRMPPRI